MSVQCKYIIGLHCDKNPIIIGYRHNIACPLGCCPEIMNGSVNVYQICNNPVAKNYAVLVREGYI